MPWEMGPPHEPPVLSSEQAIEIALSDQESEIRGLPVTAEYGTLRQFRHGERDLWQVRVDVSSLGWDVQYEGPGSRIIDGEHYNPHHVEVPRVWTLILIVDDKLGRRTVSATEPDPNGVHRVEWRKAYRPS